MNVFSVVLGGKNMRVGLPVPWVSIGKKKEGSRELKMERTSIFRDGFLQAKNLRPHFCQ